MVEGLIEREFYIHKLAAEHAEFAVEDFIGFFEESTLTIITQDLLELFAGGERKERRDITLRVRCR